MAIEVDLYSDTVTRPTLDMRRFIGTEMDRGRSPREIWAGLEERVRSYKIVD